MGKFMDINNLEQKFIIRLRNIYKRLNKLTGGVLGIIRRAFEGFSEQRGSEAAAGLAYYAFFSIFPMLLVFIVIGSFFIDRAVVQSRLLEILQGVIPGAKEVVIENIDRVLELRGAVTFIALISLIWSATSVFNILAKNINRAFPKAGTLNFIKGRLRGFWMFLGLGLLMLLSFASSTVIGLVPSINIPLNGKALHETFLWRIFALSVPVLLNMLLFWAIYYFVPTTNVSRRASITGGLIAGIAWQLLNRGFTWYLSSGLSKYRLIYGSLGTVVALLFWIYLTATILLLGAHLTASIHQHIDEKSNGH
jgi:membrane protein